MSFPTHLLEQARHLATRERTGPPQASLRRASLLISEAALNWKNADQRATFARLFEHGKMKSASDKQRAKIDAFLDKDPRSGPELTTARRLHKVAGTFVLAQQQRHAADYDDTLVWSRSDVLSQIDSVSKAFQSWHAIRNEPIAQAYLLALLGKPHTN